MKVFNIIFIVIFIIFTGLQYNDPDPYIWMPIYLYVAYLCYLAIKGKAPVALYVIGYIAYGAYAIYLLVDSTGVLSWINQHHSESIVQTMKATKPWIEETREFGGLLINMIVMTINLIWVKNSRPRVVSTRKAAVETNP
jgi:Transmembrane family 220, helix